jgi:hypothetical protein
VAQPIDAGALIKRAEAERNRRRSQWHTHWEECAHFFHANRLGFIGEYTAGEERFDENWTSAPQIARRDLAQAMGSWTRPHGRNWVVAKARNDSLNYVPEVRAWLQAVSRLTYLHMYSPAAHFEERAAEFDDDLITFGTAVMFVEEAMHRNEQGETRKRLFFHVPHLRDVIPLENAFGDIDGMAMFQRKSLRKIARQFPDKERWPKQLQDKVKGENVKWDDEEELLNVVLPNDEFALYGFGPKRQPYASVWIHVASKEEIDRGGHMQFPYVVGRWETVSGELYGRSPAMMALNDARTANGMSGSLLELIEKAANPPQTAPADMIRGDVELWPGGLTLYDGGGFAFQGSPIKAVELGKEPQGLAQFIERLETRIEKAFFAHVLQLPEAEREFTSDEIQARMQQQFEKAAPIFARVQSEFNAPLLDRVFNILMRNGVYPEPPEEIQGEEIVFGFDTPVQAALEEAEANRSLMAMSTLMNMGPEAAQNVNLDVAARTIARQKGLPEVFLKPEEQVAQERAQLQRLQEAQQLSEVAKNAAPAIKAASDAGDSSTVQQLLDQNALPPPGGGGQ